MDQNHDFSALRNLLALRRLEVPMDTEVNRFLIEFHRRQRAQLLVKESAWARVTSWLGERISFAPSLSYASGLACVAVIGFLSFSTPTQITSSPGHYQLSLSMPGKPAAFALLPSSYVREGSTGGHENMSFTSSARADATRFVLANSRVAYDATAAF